MYRYFYFKSKKQCFLTGVPPSLSGELSGDGGSTTMLVTLQELSLHLWISWKTGRGHHQQSSVLCKNCWSASAFPLLSVCQYTWLMTLCVYAPEKNTLPFSGRIIDWEWLSCCLTSCRGPELSDWASALLNAIVFRASEEAARCMLFTGVKGQGQDKCLGQWWKVEQTHKRKGDHRFIVCELV